MTQFSATTTGEEVVNAFKDHVKGKTFVITGPSEGGIGAQTAISLAHAGPRQIVLAGRSESKIQPVIDEIKKVNSEVKASFVPLDLGEWDSVRRAADAIKGQVESIDVLVNNAGIMAVREYTKSAEGIESQFAANHVGHFLLTNLLLEKMGRGGRIVNLTSMGYEVEGIRFDDWNFQDGKTYNAWLAYGQSKTANILFGVALTKKLKAKGIESFAVHPGLILDTKLLTNVSQDMFAEGFKIATEKNGGVPVAMETPKNLQTGCSTTLVAALDPSIEGSSGALLADCAIADRPVKDYAKDAGNADKLWSLSEKLVGQAFG